MRVILYLLLATLFAAPADAQQITQPAKSIPGLLCKKWVGVYTEMGGTRIAPQAGTPLPFMVFKKDRSVVFTGGGSPANKGTWAYDPIKKRVKITFNGKNKMSVVQLQQDQLTMSIDTKDATPDDPITVLMVFKVKS